MALYLKYRPQDFNSLVGQGFIKETLKKAVADDKTVWAYLFTGPRGTGKTSSARIFAKAINCENPQEGNPCNSCDICKAFSENSLIDIIEIDAASHTGVDNIREIIEKAQFSPTKTKYKIYIIDEVHMLSKGAFNALLKILEEPPKHVKFILATTEIHKVPDTILSRCQRYDFKNHTDADVEERLRYIAQEEWISVDDESYKYIVKSAEWGLRNAISLFEQLIHDNKIEFAYITETLGVASEDEKKNFIEKIFEKDFTLLDDFEEILKSGKNLKNFFKDITNDVQRLAIKDLKSGLSIDTYIRILDVLQDILEKAKRSFDEALTFRIGILKILWENSMVSSQPSPLEEKGQTTNKMQSSSPSKGEDQGELSSAQERDALGRIQRWGTQKETEVSIKKEEPSLIDEVQDIFAWESTFEEHPFDDLGGQMTPKQSFDINTLISEVKKQWGKAALTMSIKGAKVHIDEHILQMHTKTKIAYSTIDKPENRDIIIAACENMGIDITSVQIH